MTAGRRNLVIVAAVVAVVAAGAGLVLWLTGGDQPDELTFDDATATTAAPSAGADAPSTTAPSDVDGTWVVTDRSQAGYRLLKDALGGVQTLESVGRTSTVTGGFTVEGTTVSDVEVVVDVGSITSDSALRDSEFRGTIMDAAQFPTATFAVAEVDLADVPADGSTASVPVEGQFTMKGVTRDVATTLEVRRAGAEVQVLGSFPVRYGDYGIARPSIPGVELREEGTVEFLVVAERDPAAAPAPAAG